MKTNLCVTVCPMTLCWCQIVLVSDCAGVRLRLDALKDWCSEWRVKFNHTKSKIVHFRKEYVCRTTFVLVVLNWML